MSNHDIETLLVLVCLPRGLSPSLNATELSRCLLTGSQRSLVLDMFDEHLSGQFSDKLCKWTDTSALEDFESKLKTRNTGVSMLLENWNNPVFAAPEKVSLT